MATYRVRKLFHDDVSGETYQMGDTIKLQHDRASTLRDLGYVGAPVEPENKTGNSIKIDLAGSKEVKKQIEELEKAHSEEIEKLNTSHSEKIEELEKAHSEQIEVKNRYFQSILDDLSAVTKISDVKTIIKDVKSEKTVSPEDSVE